MLAPYNCGRFAKRCYFIAGFHLPDFIQHRERIFDRERGPAGMHGILPQQVRIERRRQAFGISRVTHLSARLAAAIEVEGELRIGGLARVQPRDEVIPRNYVFDGEGRFTLAAGQRKDRV
jgi:hypothetical protein